MWSRIWGSNIHNRHKLFIWRLVANTLPTRRGWLVLLNLRIIFATFMIKKLKLSNIFSLTVLLLKTFGFNLVGSLE